MEKVKCAECGEEYWPPEMVKTYSGDDICLDCAGYAPPTCGTHGDY